MSNKLITLETLETFKQGVDGDKMKNILYADLVTLRGNSGLIPGQWYRITDYVTTTVQSNTQSAGHQFDVIVRADDVNVLNENAYAALHDGDTYFSTAGARLEAWELKYCLNNDTTKFAWADSTNGKGVIYWMKDENGNECPYDFKNIMFRWTSAISQSGIKANVYYYTFSVAAGTADATVTDNSLNGGYCYANKIGLCITANTKQKLNGNVFRNTSAAKRCMHNSFGNDCYDNTFGNSCYYNTFGNKCIANKVSNSVFDNSFGEECSYNTIGANCSYNSFGNGCTYCSLLGNCSYNKYGDGLRIVNIGKTYSQFIIVENGNRYINLNCSATTSSSSLFQNVKIAQGVNTTNDTKVITHATAGDTFQTIYKPTNSVEVSV